MKNRRALSVGYVVLDVILHDGGMGQAAGGTAGNVAANLAYLGWDASVAAMHGDDPAGKHLKADLLRAGVASTALLCRPSFVTPVVIHEVLPSRHRFRFGCPECGRRFANFRPIPLSHAERVLAEAEPDVLFVDRVSKAAVLMARTVAARGGIVVFEPSLKGNQHRFEELVTTAHVLKCSAERIDPKDPVLQVGPPSQLQIMTRGREGAEWRYGKQGWRHIPAFETTVVDAGGAGDWTTAALIDALGCTSPDQLANADVSEALRHAQAVAAVSCQVPGARGMSRALEPEELTNRVQALRASGRRFVTDGVSLRRSRRASNCEACLA